MKVSLVCPTNDHGESASKGIYYPMGILSVGSVLKDTYPDIEVQLLDGELYATNDLERKVFGSDILGLSANTCNYQYCLDLAEFAKESGVRQVILGGPHASAILDRDGIKVPMAELILRNRPSIDFVVMYEGEKAFTDLITSQIEDRDNYEGISNLFYRTSEGEIKANKTFLPKNIPRFIDMNFSLMSFENYWQEHKKEFPNMSEKYIEGFTHIGCAWRETSGCTFCDIPYPTNKYQLPGRFWRDLREAKNTLGINSFKDYGDNFTGNSERVEALLKSRPKDLEDMEFSCYGRSVEVTEKMADMLKELNMRYHYIGFESGNNEMLRNMRAGYSSRANELAIERLEKRGINISGSLVLGTIGENEESIRETEDFARQAVRSPNVTQLHCAIMMPFPGAPLNREFLKTHPEYISKDIWDTELTKRFWIDQYCNVPLEYIEAKARDINSLNPSSRKRYFGFER